MEFFGFEMGNLTITKRVRKHRDMLRMQGLHPVQILVPDSRCPNFAKECRRQSRLVAEADTAMQQFMDESLTDVDGWV